MSKKTKETANLGQIFGFIWRHWRKRPKTLAVLVSLIVLSILAQVLQPIYAGRFVDWLAAPSPSPDGSEPDTRYSNAAIALGLFIGLNLIRLIAHTIADLMFASIQSRQMQAIVDEAFFKVQRFSTDWHNNTFAGATVRKVTRGMRAFETLTDTIYGGFLPSVLIVVGMTIMLSLIWPEMGVFVTVSIILYIAWNYFASTRWLSPYNSKAAEADTELGAMLADSVTCNATVKAFARETNEDERIQKTSRNWRARTIAAWLRGTSLHGVQNLHLTIMQSGLLAIALIMWKMDRATPGQVALVLSSYFVVHGYLRELGRNIRHFQNAANDISDTIFITEAGFDIDDVENAAELKANDGEIIFDSMTFAYAGQPNPIYEDFSIQIASGEQVALVGKSGSGKSTFVKLIQRLYDIQSGDIRIDGQSIAHVSQTSLRRAIALVPQEPTLFHRTISENIAYARPDATQTEIESAAIRARAHEFIAKLPAGYDTLVGERGVKLSGGERQRVAIARAFLADAPILVLDEATSSLDSHTEMLIQEAIEELMRGRTTIVIAHRLSTIQKMERILVFSDGRIVEQGTHAELLALPDGRYRELHELQVEALIAE